MSDLHDIWHHRWLTHKAHVKKSAIYERGIFAKKPIRKGEVVRIMGGIIVPKSDIKKYTLQVNFYTENIALDISDDFFIAPTHEDLKKPATINHSCSPNTGFRDPITFIAIKNIPKGEEIVFDYAFSQTCFEPFTCNCKSARCRGTITPRDWKIKKLQQTYGTHFSPYLKKRFLRSAS
jgi:SET domain-containing protein